MNHILVIGGTGTVGRQVLSRLAATGAHVRALARNPGARLPPQVEVVRGDLTLPSRVTKVTAGVWKKGKIRSGPNTICPGLVKR